MRLICLHSGAHIQGRIYQGNVHAICINMNCSRFAPTNAKSPVGLLSEPYDFSKVKINYAATCYNLT
jgi:hypothetical protein